MRPLTKPQRAWCLYDWANSAYATSILAALLPVYFTRTVAPQGGIPVSLLGFSWHAEAASLWGYAVSASFFVVALSAPVLGAVADHTGGRKAFLCWFTGAGAIATIALLWAEPGAVYLTLALFVASHVCYLAAEVFYNAFLPHLASPAEQDRLSGYGYALGYAGGGLLLAAHIAFLGFHEAFGVADRAHAARLCLASAGVWWAVFAIPSCAGLPGSLAVRGIRWRRATAEGFRRVARTLREARARGNLLRFLLAYLLYNDAIQTVIVMASVFGAVELGLPVTTLLGALLLTQLVAFPGAVLFARWAERRGAKEALLSSLFAWCVVLVWAVWISRAWEFWLLAGVVGLILGGSQALSRSLYARLIPREQAGEFFSFYAIGGKFSAILGPFLFGVVTDVTGNQRLAFVAILVLLALGLTILSGVNPEAGNETGP